MISSFFRRDTHRTQPVEFLKQILCSGKMNLTKHCWGGKLKTITFIFFNPTEIGRVLANAPASSRYAIQRAANTGFHRQIACSLLPNPSVSLTTLSLLNVIALPAAYVYRGCIRVLYPNNQGARKTHIMPEKEKEKKCFMQCQCYHELLNAVRQK